MRILRFREDFGAEIDPRKVKEEAPQDQEFECIWVTEEDGTIRVAGYIREDGTTRTVGDLPEDTSAGSGE